MIFRAQDVRHCFDEKTTLEFPALAVDVGERVLIMGPSGCGKSTLLNLISGVLPLQDGHIELLGQTYQGLSGRALDQLRADHIGVIFQTLNLIPHLSARRNAALALRFSPRRRTRVEDIDREYARLSDALGLPAHIADQHAKHLSIGQQQRIAVIRALLGHPELILADEPTSALDPDSTALFMNELMSSFDRNRQGLIVVSHNPALRAFFDTVITLEARP